MKLIAKPDWLLDATCEAPPSREALLGWYQPGWCPWTRLELHRAGGHVVATWYSLEEGDGGDTWRASLRDELTPLSNACAYAVVDDPFQANRALRYAYNEILQRFEVQIETGDPLQVTRIPLARIPRPVMRA